MIKIKQLHETDFSAVINLSLSIFNPKEGKDDRYHNINNWKEYFKQKGILLGAFLNNKLVGYLFCYEKEPNKNTLHCWMAGVSEKHRRQGILKKLMIKLTEVLRERGYEVLTINTWPEKFPAMYAYLTKYGYEKYKEEEKEWEGQKTLKSFFRKKIE